VPEAARLLRAGGLLAFSGSTPIFEICTPLLAPHPEDRLAREYFGLQRRVEEGWVEFNLSYGEWIRLFRSHGFAIEDLIELRPPENARSTFRDEIDLAWARRWPMEQIWRVRRL
jgi:hypothetical protein